MSRVLVMIILVLLYIIYHLLTKDERFVVGGGIVGDGCGYSFFPVVFFIFFVFCFLFFVFCFLFFVFCFLFFVFCFLFFVFFRGPTLPTLPIGPEVLQTEVEIDVREIKITDSMQISFYGFFYFLFFLSISPFFFFSLSLFLHLYF